jgi:hypothetical protein
MPEGDQDDPGDDLRKWVAAQRAHPLLVTARWQGKLLFA